jgi:hypothetical protein
MRKRTGSGIVILTILLVLASCAPYADSGGSQLAFEAPVSVDSAERFHVSLGVRNLGEQRFRNHEAFNGAMTLRDDGGTELGRIQVATLWELAPDGAGWPAAYASELPAGAYQLTWGSPDLGSVTVDFSIVELEGRRYLGKEAIQSTAAGATPGERQRGAFQPLVDLARVSLARKLGIDPDSVTVQSVEDTEFPDASLGVPEPGQMYAQVLTPGYRITLAAGGQTYEYHASDSRLVFFPQEDLVPRGSITVEGVQVTEGQQIVVHGRSTLPDGTRLGSELWADGVLQSWWPAEACLPVEEGAWQIVVPLGAGEIPAELDPSAQYMVRVFQKNGPDIVSVLAFDLAGPPTPVAP